MYRVIYVGRRLAVCYNPIKHTVNLPANIPHLANCIKQITDSLTHGYLTVLTGTDPTLCLQVNRVTYSLDPVNKYAMASYKVTRLAVFDQQTSVNTWLTTRITDIAPWQRTQVAQYQRENLGYALE